MPAADAAALRECTSILLRSLYPVVPHVAHALWVDLDFGALGRAGDIIDAPWPAVDEAALVRETQELVLQVNGKVRGAAAAAGRAPTRGTSSGTRPPRRKCCGWPRDAPPKRIVIVPGRLVNVVL